MPGYGRGATSNSLGSPHSVDDSIPRQRADTSEWGCCGARRPPATADAGRCGLATRSLTGADCRQPRERRPCGRKRTRPWVARCWGCTKTGSVLASVPPPRNMASGQVPETRRSLHPAPTAVPLNAMRSAASLPPHRDPLPWRPTSCHRLHPPACLSGRRPAWGDVTYYVNGANSPMKSVIVRTLHMAATGSFR